MAAMSTQSPLDPQSISNALQILREYETIAHWRRPENIPRNVTVLFKPHSNRLLGYGAFLTNSRGETILAKTFHETKLISRKQQTQFAESQNASVEIKLLARAVDVVRDDMLADCRLLSGELEVEQGLVQVAQELYSSLEVGGIRLFGMPQSHFEHRVYFGLTAFLVSVANSADCSDEKISAMWNHIVLEAEELYYALECVAPNSPIRTGRKLFDIEGAPTLYDSMLFSLNTLTLEHLPGSDVIKRCCAHRPMQSMSDAPLREGVLPLPEAIRDAFARIKFPFLALNGLSVNMKWSGEYVNNRGAVSPDGICRQLDPRQIFQISAKNCYDMDIRLRSISSETDSNGLTIALICATDVLSSSETPSEVRNLAFCFAREEELALKYKSGTGKVAGVVVAWRDFELLDDESGKEGATWCPLVDKIRTTWSVFLHEVAQKQAARKLMPELPFTQVMHYQNMNLFRPLRKSIATNLGMVAGPPLGGHLLDCKSGSNYIRNQNMKKRYIVREGKDLKLVKRFAHRFIYYTSRIAFDAGQYKLQMDLRSVIINQHTTTRELLEIMMEVGQDHASTKYALKFIEDTMMKFDNRSACFLPLNSGQEGLRLSAVLGADLLSNVDCLVKPSTGEVFLLIGVRFLKLERLGPQALHAREVPQPNGLQRSRIKFDSVVGDGRCMLQCTEGLAMGHIRHVRNMSDDMMFLLESGQPAYVMRYGDGYELLIENAEKLPPRFFNHQAGAITALAMIGRDDAVPVIRKVANETDIWELKYACLIASQRLGDSVVREAA